MSVVYEKVVKEDIELGHGTVQITSPAGGTLNGSKVGIHSFLGPSFLNANDFSGASVSARIDAAINEAVSIGVGIVIVPPGMGTGDPTVYSEAVTLLDFRGGTPISGSFNSLSLNAQQSNAGQEPRGLLLQMYRNNFSASSCGAWLKNKQSGTLPNNAVVIGGTLQADTVGAVTPPANFGMVGAEGVANIDSTGGTVRYATAFIGSVHTTAASSTGISEFASIYYASQITDWLGSGSKPPAMFSAVLEPQTLGTSRNGSLWAQGPIVMNVNAVGQLKFYDGTSDYPVLGMSSAPNRQVWFQPGNDSYGFAFYNAAKSTIWAQLMGGQFFMGVAAPVSNVRMDIENSSFANDARTELIRFAAGADQTTDHTLAMGIGFYPSATASSRYVRLEVGDFTGGRALVINSGGGKIIMGATANDGANTLQVTGGISLVTGALDIKTGGTISISSGTGSVKMASAGNANNAAWIPIKYSGTTYYVPGWTTNAP